jgi:hypothetical protein
VALSVTSGQCKLVAEIADPGDGFVVASGHPQFVVGAAARQQKIYTAYVEANGFDAAGMSGPIDKPPSSLLNRSIRKPWSRS